MKKCQKFISRSPYFLFPPTSFHSITQSYHDVYIKQAIFRLLCISEPPTLIRVLGPTQAYASTIHSYQTFVSSVWRHILTSSSES